jgi:hypothetical protein
MSAVIGAIKNLSSLIPQVQLSKQNVIIGLAAINSGIALHWMQPDTYTEKAAIICVASVATYFFTETVNWAQGKIKNEIINYSMRKMEAQLRADGVEFKENGDIVFTAKSIETFRKRYQNAIQANQTT